MAATKKTQNPEISTKEMQENWVKIAHNMQHLWQAMAKRQASGPVSPSSTLRASKAFAELSARLSSDPSKLYSMNMQFWNDSMQLWQDATQRALGEPAPAKPNNAKKDKRFKDDAWDENFVFDFLKESYLLVSKHLHDGVLQVDGMSPQTSKTVEFYTKQWVDALSPSNYPLTNPEVLRATLETHGENLSKGVENLLRDIEDGSIKMSDGEPFIMGQTIASTPGKVVFKNNLMELIQYTPTTSQVYETPMLMIPAWINKYYVLDLQPENSLVKWLVEQGHTVFMISWVNPDGTYRNTRFDDYMTQGVIAAMDAIESITKQPSVNAVGYCLGGTLLSITSGYLSAKKQSERLKSMTLLTTLIDFSDPGELGVFVDEEQIDDLQRRMESKGYLDGRDMAMTFNLLRANDLIWSFVVQNYLLGKTPFPFDMLYWNSDATRLPATMHNFYMRNMYLHNHLKDPGGIIVDRIAIDLHQVKTPVYFLSAQDDHIAPWESTYMGTNIFKGPLRFVLTGSGHIAGVINSPHKNKYAYRTNALTPEDAQSWLNGSSETAGSWWPDWQRWVKTFAGRKISARTLDSAAHKKMTDAPGDYVKVRS